MGQRASGLQNTKPISRSNDFRDGQTRAFLHNQKLLFDGIDMILEEKEHFWVVADYLDHNNTGGAHRLISAFVDKAKTATRKMLLPENTVPGLHIHLLESRLSNM